MVKKRKKTRPSKHVLLGLRRWLPGTNTKRNHRFGLTLIELVAVLSLLAVLLVLFFGGFGRLKRGAARAADIGNMRQIGLAIEQFTQDHFNEGRIFFAHDRWEGEHNRYGYGSKSWFVLLRPYFGLEMDDPFTEVPVFISPGDPTRGGGATRHAAPNHAFMRRSYSFNTRTNDPGTLTPGSNTNARRKASIRNPSGFLLFANHRATEVGTIWIDPNFSWSIGAIPDDWFDNGLANFAFLDGHIESIPVKDVMPGGARHGIFTPQLEQ